jgi:hypothetical protein
MAQPAVVVHAYNSSTQETGAGRYPVGGQPQLQQQNSVSKNKSKERNRVVNFIFMCILPKFLIKKYFFNFLN